jgi:glycine/D-amino acid oxidase-like deaminating enzyme
MADSSEILIIGGGVIGVCFAYYLAERGARPTFGEKPKLDLHSLRAERFSN